jgi:putative transposase
MATIQRGTETQGMKLTAKVKLLATDEQRDALLQTMRVANEACNYISDYAWENETFGKYALQKAIYYDVRERFDLSAQVVVRCLAKVGDAYKLDRKSKHVFRPLSSIAYDDRILKWKLDRQAVSIWSVEGRLSIPFAAGPRQLALLKTRQGESDLVFHRGKFYLFATCNVEEPDPIDVDGALGVDLGVTNIAVDSGGEFHSASHVKSVRHRHKRLRAKLKKKGTKSAKRRLKKLSGKEARFAHNVNHCISKHLVNKAQRTRCVGARRGRSPALQAPRTAWSRCPTHLRHCKFRLPVSIFRERGELCQRKTLPPPVRTEQRQQTQNKA